MKTLNYKRSALSSPSDELRALLFTEIFARREKGGAPQFLRDTHMRCLKKIWVCKPSRLQPHFRGEETMPVLQLL